MAAKLTEQTNGFDRAILSQFVKDIDRLKGEIESRKGAYMAWCKSQRELINDVLDRAKDAGIPKKELKAVLKARDLEKKIEKIREDLEEGDAADTFDMIREALGDLAGTPLGRAAMGEGADEDADEDADEPDQAAENVTRLTAGMKPLKG